MVQQRRRAQASFSPRSPGLAVQRAQNVPFIPATRRTGVGDNAQRTGSALGRLGSALGTFISSQEPSQAEIHAERKRVEEKIHLGSKETPEQRALNRAKDGVSIVSDKLKQITDLRENVLPPLQSALTKRTQEWAATGWTTTDNDGAQVPVTEEDINRFYTEMTQANVFDVYKVKGEEGRLHRPQVAELTRTLNAHKAKAISDLRNYKRKELSRDGYESVESDAEKSLLTGYIAQGLRGQQLFDAWAKGGLETYGAITGNKTYMKASRSTILAKQLEGLFRKMDTANDAKIIGELLDAKLDGSGATLRNSSHRGIIESITKKANILLGRADEAEARQEFTKSAMLSLGKTDTYDFSEKTIRMPDGTVRKFSEKEQKDAVIKQVKVLAKVSAGSEKDPSKKWLEYQRTVGALRGTDLIDDEIKDQFTSANFGIASNDEKQMNNLLTVYRDIKTFDPTKLNKYVRDSSVRARLRNMERMLDNNPALGIQGALEVIQRGMTPEGTVHPWENFPGELKKLWGAYRNSSEFTRAGLFGEDVDTLDAILRLKLTDPSERRKYETDGVEGISKVEFKAAIVDEVENLKSQKVSINGTTFDPPPGEVAEHYKVKVESIIQDLSKELSVDGETLRVSPLPHNAGMAFLDANGNPLQIERDGKKYKVVYSNKQILDWVKAKGESDLTARIIRSQGNSALKRSVKENAAAIERSREARKQIKSTWSKWLGISDK